MNFQNHGLQVMPAVATDAPLLAGLIATAFHDLQPARWQIPDDQLRRAVFPAMFEDYVRHALGHGAVEMTAQVTAVAVWTVETGQVQPAPTPPAGRLAAALGDAAARVHAFDRALYEREPIGAAFEKLALLAVRPGHQGHGIGSGLLAHHLTDLDARQAPAYLEASSERSRELYRRFGFRDHGEPIELPHGPLMYPMMRQPLGCDDRDHG